MRAHTKQDEYYSWSLTTIDTCVWDDGCTHPFHCSARSLDASMHSTNNTNENDTTKEKHNMRLISCCVFWFMDSNRLATHTDTNTQTHAHQHFSELSVSISSMRYILRSFVMQIPTESGKRMNRSKLWNESTLIRLIDSSLGLILIRVVLDHFQSEMTSLN